MNDDKLRGKARQTLAQLGGHAAEVAAAERRLLQRASARVDAITARLEVLRSKTATESVAAEEYLALVAERGRLHGVVARARQTLAG